MKGLPPDHKCSRPHGHSYTVRVELENYELDAKGFVIDFGELQPLKEYIKFCFDHRDLNAVSVLEGTQTSSENLARHFFYFCKNLWPQTVRVGISETAKSWAFYDERKNR